MSVEGVFRKPNTISVFVWTCLKDRLVTDNRPHRQVSLKLPSYRREHQVGAGRVTAVGSDSLRFDFTVAPAMSSSVIRNCCGFLGETEQSTGRLVTGSVP